MFSALSTSASGMRSALRMLDISAHNTANINTDGFKRQRVTVSEAPAGGVTTGVETVKEAGPTYLSSTGAVVEASNVNYTDELLNQMTARHYFKANVAAYRTAYEMEESILDIVA